MAFSTLLKIVVFGLFVETVLSDGDVTNSRTYTDENGVEWTEETVDDGTVDETIDDDSWQDDNSGSWDSPGSSYTDDVSVSQPSYQSSYDNYDDNTDVNGEKLLFDGGDIDEDGKYVKFNNIKRNSRIKVIFESDPGACTNL